jgi:hypothetical protein
MSRAIGGGMREGFMVSMKKGGLWIVGEWLYCHGHMHETYPHLAALCCLIMRIILILLLLLIACTQRCLASYSYMHQWKHGPVNMHSVSRLGNLSQGMGY